MKSFKHVLHTWLLAHALHPFIFTIGLYIITNEEIGDVFFFLWIGAMAFSLPSLFCTALLFDAIARMECSKWERIFVWSVFSGVCIVANVVLIPVIFFNGWFFYEYFQLALPALLAVFLSILIRHQQFENYLLFSENRDDKASFNNNSGSTNFNI